MESTLTLNEIATEIRHRLIVELPECKFSLTQPHSRSMILALMSGPFAPFSRLEDTNGNTLRNLYAQLNPYQLERDPEDAWVQGNIKWQRVCNGVSLTSECWKVMARATKIANEHNWDESDIQSDYHNCCYYLSVHIGKWSKPFIQTFHASRAT